MRRSELSRKVCAFLFATELPQWGWENESSDNFFAWGGSTMCHPPVLVIEAFNDGAK